MNYQFKKQAELNDEVEVTMLDVKSAAQAYRDREKRDKKPDSAPENEVVGHGLRALATESAIGKDERKIQVAALFNAGMTSYIDLSFEMNLAESTIRQYGKELGLTFIDTEY
ncbi:hypothetical protein GCM10025878_09000 [Leuconostoc gasicomitatum]|uniref:Uncharacterized protein n=2 Tax=Leuconostoc TaxID=1243 RepID=A0AAN2QUE7_9LACO|nr:MULTISPECIES: hypothetical protein [Leuconostoc]MBZ5943420.1 hypothetical protein [Leuconostoc gasicomitatum]MBZ5946300.1 hypothetical protein [Leuconostoc gasicomitatum]MBZ5950125.1 hypothetical protein [Leuconostoc gasicomitatum]MBZ5952794.1 hypothetical protein [Leuconostoc gasicomitatum]MBZ5957500.1 hypothetical protein [Leuconostoc gasicomitatum]